MHSNLITMKSLKAFCFLFGCAVVLSSCAGSYHPIYPRSLQYNHSSAPQAPVDMGYRYGVLAEKDNKKFARKEEKKHLQLAAIKLTNNTNKPLVFGRDIQLLSNTSPLSPLPSGMVYQQLKQQTPLFLLYLLFTPAKITTTRSDGNTVNQSSFPIGLILGPGLALGNMLKASGNNDKFLAELMQHDLIGRTIQPGETVYGLVGLGNTGYGPLSIRIVDHPTAASPGQE